MEIIISGIQQIGVGVKDADKAWAWYRKYFGADLAVFKERAEAALMLPYTGGEPRSRYAILALNMQGGGGFEIWQYVSRTPQPADFEIQLGDLGICAGKIKCRNAQQVYDFYQQEGVTILSSVKKTPNGTAHFFVEDLYGNPFQIVESNNWFDDKKLLTGGAYGAFIGVTDMEKSIAFYKDILGYDTIVYDETGQFDCFEGLSGGQNEFRRVLLQHSKARTGAFSPLLGTSEVELVAVKDRTPKAIFENRLWGDLGFIHLCFDVRGMAALKAKCAEYGCPFTVDSGDFNMGEAAGHFAYIEDPDGTLIEFVETHKVPILKKVGWYLSLKNRDPQKSLPRWMLKAMGLNRTKV